MFPISTSADRENVTPQVYVGSHAVFGWAAAAKDNFHFFLTALQFSDDVCRKTYGLVTNLLRKQSC